MILRWTALCPRYSRAQFSSVALYCHFLCDRMLRAVYYWTPCVTNLRQVPRGEMRGDPWNCGRSRNWQLNVCWTTNISWYVLPNIVTEYYTNQGLILVFDAKISLSINTHRLWSSTNDDDLELFCYVCLRFFLKRDGFPCSPEVYY